MKLTKELKIILIDMLQVSFILHTMFMNGKNYLVSSLQTELKIHGILVKIPTRSFVQVDKLIIKFIWK